MTRAMIRSLVLSLFVVGVVVAHERPHFAGTWTPSRPDFSGRWILDLGRSKVHPVYFKDITKGEVRITHIDPSFAFVRTFVKAGRDEVVQFTLAADGKEVEGNEDGMPTRSSLTWSGDTLVFLTIYRAPRGEARNTVTYNLHDAGKTLRAAESFRGPMLSYDNVWVFWKVH